RGGSLLKQISGRAGSYGLLDMFVISISRENNDFRSRHRFENLARSLPTVQQRHRQIHHNNFWPMLKSQLDRFTASLRFSDDMDVAFREKQSSKALPDNIVIIYQ